MTNLTDKFEALESQINDDADEAHSQRATIESTLEDIQTTLSNINADMLAMQRSLLGALATSAACSTCPSVPLSGTPPITTETPASNPFCQRVQAFLAFISECATFADATGTLSGAFTTGFITSIVDQIRVDLGDSGIPYPSWLDTLALAADGVNFVINRALLGGGCHDTLDPLLGDLQAAMYAAGSPSAASDAYMSMIDGASGLGASKPLLKGFAYGDAVNYFLDPSSSPVLTPYNGAVCGIPAGCIFIESQAVTVTDPSFPDLTHRQMILIPDWVSYGASFLSSTFSPPAVLNLGETGGQITQLSGGACRIVYHDSGGNHAVPLVIGTPFTITSSTDSFFLDDVTPGLTLSGAWSCQYCPPGS